MEANFVKKVKNKDLFIYAISGDEKEISTYKELLGQFYRISDDGKPLFFTKFYGGQQRPLIQYNGKYMLDMKKLFFLDKSFINEKQNLWTIIDHAISKDPRINKRTVFWSINKSSNDSFNSNVHKLPTNLKTQLFSVLDEYKIAFDDHAKLTEQEAEEYINELVDMEKEAYDDYQSEHRTNWTNYNDNLDMDQQSDEFWNQF